MKATLLFNATLWLANVVAWFPVNKWMALMSGAAALLAATIAFRSNP